MNELDDILGETTQFCHNCDAEIKSEIRATKSGDRIGTTYPFVCPYCGWNL